MYLVVFYLFIPLESHALERAYYFVSNKPAL